ncbi:hypothetical protein BDZ89DRAFT_1065204 [Hymenopellis radicata]|nr:hypothetical protein BDZ89DRAFT_1065204 [Hymenopellis radicata]
MQVDVFNQAILAESPLWNYVLPPSQPSIYADTLAIPVYAGALSAAVLFLHAVFLFVAGKGEQGPTNGHVKSLGGWTIFACMLLRIVGSLFLVALTVVTGESDLLITFVYSALLAILAVGTRPRWSRILTRHYNFILLVTFGVYFYRDVYPVMTYTHSPQDSAQAAILWAKIALVTLLGAAIPLGIPRPYIPLDPSNPTPEPNPEQTASLFSLAVHYYLDPIVFKAYSLPHLPLDQLPPLADYDEASALKQRGFPFLDVFSGAPKRHLVFGLMRVFRKDYIVMFIMSVINVLFTFAAPVGLNRLLAYIETGGEGATVRPWVWICGLFVGPMAASISIQWYIFTATRLITLAEALLTQLTFEHSLRIRMKAATPESTPSSTPSLSVAGSDSDDTVHDGSSTSSDNTTASEETATAKPASAPVEHSDTSNLVGKINNLVTTDLENIVSARDFLLTVVYIPMEVALCIVFLYNVIGWSALVGLVFIIMTLPVPALVAQFTQMIQENRLKKTDGRVQLVTEILNVLRMIKLFGWEAKMDGKLASKREEELIWIRKRQILDLVNYILNLIIPLITMIITFGFQCTLVMKQSLSASVVFSSMSVFDILRDQLHMIFASITDIMSGKVSLDRMNKFLHETELLDSYSSQGGDAALLSQPSPSSEIGFRDASFIWSNSASDGSLTPSKRKFSLRVDGSLEFKKGCINLVVGPTGSGKTSLLMALLGEMHFVRTGPNGWYNLPRASGVAYAAQESWVQNETIRVGHFLPLSRPLPTSFFGSPYDETRYQKVIYECGLERDLTFGREGLDVERCAMYSSAKTILLDDVLAALDVHTSKWIVDKCLSGDLAKGRTIILVTHNITLCEPIADFVVSIKDGRIVSQGSLSEALKSDETLQEETKVEEEIIAKADQEVDEDSSSPTHNEDSAKKPSGQLIIAEEIDEGHVSWSALNLYFKALGGNHVWLFFLAYIGGLVLTQLLNTVQTWWLGYWASQYEGADEAYVPVAYYIAVYSALALVAVMVYALAILIYFGGAIRASRTIHQRLVGSILGTTLSLPSLPGTVDGPVAMWFLFVVDLTVMLLVKFLAIVTVTPLFVVPAVFVFVAGGICGQIYIKAQLSVKREMSNAKAPVLSQISLASIRAYGVQAAFIDESLKRINTFSRASRTYYNLNRWICIRIDAFGGLFAAALATYLVYFQDQAAVTTGFSLNMAIGFSGLILWWVRNLNEFEVQANSLERIQQYLSIEQEPKPTEPGTPPAYWPASGSLVVENLSARYSVDGPKVLQDISFELKSGERVGVVGRTGSGKSSLTLSLLRCIFTEGSVYYDGLPTSTLNLDALRKSITIIPQMPELLSGTLRQNLDPFDQYDDATLNDALRASGLFALQAEDAAHPHGDEKPENHITLDTSISSGGNNLSVGQRQILALARAIVRGSKLLILDEATSAIDYKTDSIIQNSLRHELGAGDVTLITVAHRLQTIMDADKIMVLDAGRLVEFDSPKALLEIPDGKLRALVDESSDREALYAMARDGRT